MADKSRIPRPLGWCSRCLARGAGEHPAVTMNSGSGLCQQCNAAVSHDSPVVGLLNDVAAEAQSLLVAGLGEVRNGLSRSRGGRPG